MGLFRKKPVIEPDERRISKRVRVDCPAVFALPRGERLGRLADLSEHGARLELDRPPAIGALGILVIGEVQTPGKVLWVGEAACGLAFEKAIPAEFVAQLAAERITNSGPAADFGNIPLAQKRSRRLAPATG